MRRSSRGAWKHRVIKKFRRKALTFQRRAKTKEEYEAWRKVEDWFNSILGKQELDENGVIVIPRGIPVDC